MTDMPDDVTNFFFTQGILGILVVVEAFVIVKLYNKLEAINEARRVDDKQTLKEVTSVLQENSQSNYVLAAKIETGKSIERERR